MTPALSFVIPLFNEEETLEALFAQITASIEKHKLGTFEVIFIDDGSTDGSWKTIATLHKRHPEPVRALRFRRNFGKAAALAAGFQKAQAPIVFTLDADLQDDPNEIPNFLKKLDQGYDLVSGWKQLRKDPFHKTFPSKCFNFITCRASGLKIHDFNCGFKAYRRDSLSGLHLYGELHRFIPFLVHEQGYRVAEIPVKHHPRKHGRSKYGWDRFFKGALDLITVIATSRFLQRPAHLFGGTGLLFGFGGTVILAYLSIMKWIAHQPIQARPLFFLGILCVLLAAQLISLGILAEIVFRISPRNQDIPQVTEELMT